MLAFLQILTPSENKFNNLFSLTKRKLIYNTIKNLILVQTFTTSLNSVFNSVGLPVSILPTLLASSNPESVCDFSISTGFAGSVGVCT